MSQLNRTLKHLKLDHTTQRKSSSLYNKHLNGRSATRGRKMTASINSLSEQNTTLRKNEWMTIQLNDALEQHTLYIHMEILDFKSYFGRMA